MHIKFAKSVWELFRFSFGFRTPYYVPECTTVQCRFTFYDVLTPTAAKVFLASFVKIDVDTSYSHHRGSRGKMLL